MEDVATGAIALLTAPFRPVVIESLPEGTQIIEIRDPRHAVIIAINEVLQGTMTDLHKGLEGEDPLSTWGRIRAQAGFYKTFVRACLKDIDRQQYKDWLGAMPPRIAFKDAPSTIVQYSNSTVTMQILVLRATVDLLVEVMDRAEKANWDDMPGAVKHALAELEHASSTIADVSAAMNRLQMLTVDNPERYDMETIFRTKPRGVPVIALVPREPADSSSKITPFPGRKAT